MSRRRDRPQDRTPDGTGADGSRTGRGGSRARSRRESDELTEVSRDPQRRGRWLRLLPLLVAAVVSGPLLWYSVLFSVEVSRIASLLFQLQAGTLTLLGVVLMSLGGFICLVGTLVCLFVGWRRDTWAWRWSWAGAATGCAALMPVLGLLIGAYWQ